VGEELHVLVGDAGFEEFAQQTAEATVFLQANSEQLRRLCAFPGVENVKLLNGDSTLVATDSTLVAAPDGGRYSGSR
jgi:hypothetical protein